MTALALSFQNTQFDVVDLNNQPWLRSPQIGGALGYKKGSDSVLKLYESNSDEFTESMTALVELETNGGKQQVRIFSLRGCHLLAMFARTEVAKEFRKWVLDILDNQLSGNSEQLPAPRAKKALPGGLTLDQQDAINDFIKQRLETVQKDKKAGMAIRIYSALNTKFETKGMKDGYKNIASTHFDNVMQLIARLPLDEKEYLTLTSQELSAIIKENPAQQGELLEKEEPNNTITLMLNNGVKFMTMVFDAPTGIEARYFVSVDDGFCSVQCVESDCVAMTPEKFIKSLTEEKGYVVVKKSDVVKRLSE